MSSPLSKVLQQHPRPASICSIGCRDAVADQLHPFVGELWLTEEDGEALERSARALEPIRHRCTFRRGNPLTVVRRFAEQLGPRFDLVIAGAVLDPYPETQAIYLLQHAWQLVKSGGLLFLRSIARDEEEMRRCCAAAGIPPSCVTIAPDETEPALLVEAWKEEVTH